MEDKNLEREDQIFKKACAQWHLRFAHDIRRGKNREADALALRVGGYAVQWQDHLDAVRKKLQEAQAEVDRLRRIEISAARRLRLLDRLYISMRRRRAEAEAEEARQAKQASGGDDETHT